MFSCELGGRWSWLGVGLSVWKKMGGQGLVLVLMLVLWLRLLWCLLGNVRVEPLLVVLDVLGGAIGVGGL